MSTSLFRNLLEKYRLKVDCPSEWANIVEMGEHKGKYGIVSTDMDKFWVAYRQAINKGDILGLAEKPGQDIPVLVDIDLKWEVDEKEKRDELYTQSNLEDVVSVYQHVLRQIVEDCNDKTLICVALQKKPYYKEQGNKEWLKHGFHLHFPYCFLNRDAQSSQLIPRVKEELSKLGTFDSLTDGNSGSVIDDCTRKPWLLYGSMKDEKAQAYLVSVIYDAELNHLSPKNAFGEYQIYDCKQRLIDLSTKDIEEFYPQIFSIIPNNRKVMNIKKNTISLLREKHKKEKKELSEYVQLTVAQNIQEAQKLLELINSTRADDYGDWMKIGWTLFNISEGTDEGFQLWNEFSQQSEKYDENACVTTWSRMTKRDSPTLGTIKYYAKIDNEAAFKQLKVDKIRNVIENAVEGSSHDDIAKLLYAEFCDEFVCADIESKMWFQFSDHIWQKTQTGVELRKKITEYILPLYEASRKKLIEEQFQFKSTGDKSATLIKEKQIESMNKVINKLKDANFQQNVMKIAMDRFYDRRFVHKLDNNRHLIAFKNGVYDFKEKVFRAGMPEDYISKSLPINYTIYNESHDKVLEVQKIFRQIFPDKEVYRYFFEMVSEIFVGGNPQKVVLFWTGEGNNGKSITQFFFDKMLGEYAVKLSTGVITGDKIKNGQADPEMARTKGVRLCTMEESNPDEEVNIGTLKRMTGNDTFFARDLFQRGGDAREITPMFKLFFICNRLPILKYADQATFNRVRVIPFESTFCKVGSTNPPPLEPEQQLKEKRFPMDVNLEQRIPELVEAFAWLLIEIYKTDRTFREPDKVLEATNSYKRKNDILQYFMNDMIVKEANNVLSIDELYMAFKDWFNLNQPTKHIPKKQDVEDYFLRIWGDYKSRKKWAGYRVRTVSDDNYEEDDDGVLFPKDEDVVDEDE